MHQLGMILVIIGLCLVALDWILGFSGHTRANGNRVGLLHLGVILIGLGVLLGAKSLV